MNHPSPSSIVSSPGIPLLNAVAGGGGLPIQQSHLQVLLEKIKQLRSQGVPDTDPVLSSYLTLLASFQHHAVSNPSSSISPTTSPTTSPSSSSATAAASKSQAAKRATASQNDLFQIQTQIYLYRLLSQNKPIPPTLLAYVAGAGYGNINLAQEIASLIASSGDDPSSATVPQSRQKTFALGATGHPLSTFAGGKIPTFSTAGIDPIELIKERERLIQQRVDSRLAELSSAPVYSMTENMKIKAMIELKSLQLLERQKSLRAKVLAASNLTASSIPGALGLVDRRAYKRTKKLTLRDFQSTANQERTILQERESKSRQKHMDTLTVLLDHGREMIAFHKGIDAKTSKLGSAVARYHIAAAKEEEKKNQRFSQERLNALKANDEEAYLKLIDKTKDTRITHLLNQTNSFLSKLTDAVSVQQATVGDLGVAAPIEETADMEPGEADYMATAHRIKEIVDVQPSILVGGKLKEYQLKGLQWMVSLYNNRLNGILADEMGLGKTIQTISLITYLIEIKKQNGPFLVIVPLSTMTNWVLEFEKWAPSVLKVAYKGGPAERKSHQAQIKSGSFNVLLTTFEYIIKDKYLLSKIKWLHMIIDEGHRMKNANSKLSQTLMQYYSSRYRLILTGTPLQNNLPELWALLNFVLPKIFNSVKTFDEWFNTPFSRETGQEKIELNEEESLLIIKRLHKVLRPFLLRRLKKDVESELPDKVETVVRIPMSALQRRLYEQIRNFRTGFGSESGPQPGGGGGGLKTKVLNNLVMQFRKICNHPFVFDEVENAINPYSVTDENIYRVAGKFELLHRILPKYKATGHRILIFFQMTAVMDIMEDYLRMVGHTFLRLDGTTKSDDRTSMLKVFNKSAEPPFIFLLSTRAGGLGLNLQTADTVIIFDSDWNPHQDLQAQDRAHRIGQTKEVRILRLVTTKSVEEHILARAQYKLDIDGKVIQAGKFDQKTTDREREELLRALFETQDEETTGADEETEESEDGSAEKGGYMSNEELNEIIARSEDEIKIFQQIDQQVEKEWISAGRKPHLFSDSELPEVYLRDQNSIPEQEKEVIEYGRGGRARKDVVYDDGLNEEQWTKAVDGGNLEDIVSRKRSRQLARRNNDVASPEPDMRSATPSGGNETQDARKATSELSVEKAFENLVSDLDADGSLVDFYDLPDSAEFPDYYAVIARPLSVSSIRERFSSSSTAYTSVEELAEDLEVMFSNALEYNQPGSDIAVTANRLVDRMRTLLSGAKRARLE